MNKMGKYILVFGILGGFTLVSIHSMIMPWYIRNSHSIPLMNLKNKPLSKAQEILKSEGFKILIHDTVYTSTVLPDIVLDQFPKSSTRVKQGRTVRLSSSQPERVVEVPNLIGQTKRNAELMLQQIGLLIDTVYSEYHPEILNGVIIWQSPKGGDVLRKGNGVHLNISKGKPPNFFQVPELYTLSKTVAEKRLKKAGLSLGKVEFKQDTTLIPYTVLDQSIIPGTVLEHPTSVDIIVSVDNLQDIFKQMMDR